MTAGTETVITWPIQETPAANATSAAGNITMAGNSLIIFSFPKQQEIKHLKPSDLYDVALKAIKYLGVTLYTNF